MSMPDREPTGELALLHDFPRIFYSSFYFSQGNADTQLYLLEEYCLDNPSMRPCHETKELLLSACTSFLLKRSPVLRRMHHPSSFGSSDEIRPDPQKPFSQDEQAWVQEGVNAILNSLIQAEDELNGISDYGRRIAIEGMLMKDKKTLGAIDERNKKEIELPTSYYLTYCLQKQPTGVAAFDRAFERMYEDIQQAKHDRRSTLYVFIESFLISVKRSRRIFSPAEKKALIESLE